MYPQRWDRPKRFEGKNFRRLAFMSIIGLASTACLSAVAVSAPLVLSDRQMDFVTAGAASLRLDLTAMAEGPPATAFTVGKVRSADTTIPLVRVSPGAVRYVTLVRTIPVTLFFAAGQATAAGTLNEDCSGGIETTGSFAYLTEASVRTQTPGVAGFPTTVNCNCAAFGIAVNQALQSP